MVSHRVEGHKGCARERARRCLAWATSDGRPPRPADCQLPGAAANLRIRPGADYREGSSAR